MLSLISDPTAVARTLAGRVRQLRLAKGWTQAELARRAGVALSTLRVFERTGQVSLVRLVMLASTLHAIDAFENLFLPAKVSSLAEIEARQVKRQRGKRGRR